MATLDIAPMSRADLDIALGWAKAEGWNPGLADADCFWAADPTGFLMGRLDGVPVGCISAVSWGPDFGFVGLYIMTPEQRGRGYGIQLWRAAIDMMGDRTIGLDGVVAQQANYARSGFAKAHVNARYRWQTPRMRPRPDHRLLPVTRENFDGILALDRACFPAPREAFLRCWLRPPRAALVLVEDGTVRGYGVMRDSVQGKKIGPLFAETPAMAEALLLGFAEEAPGETLFIDMPASNPAAGGMATKYEMDKVFETARMYRGRAPDLPMHTIFGITTLELG
jgi:GNAT superfamily N-acetyltransferase